MLRSSAYLVARPNRQSIVPPIGAAGTSRTAPESAPGGRRRRRQFPTQVGQQPQGGRAMDASAEDIARRAYERWARSGRPPGTGVQDWLAAEDELRGRTDLARQLAESALPGQGQLLQTILDHSPAVVSVKDTGGRYLLVNRRFEDLFRVGAGQALGRTDYDLFPGAVADGFRANDRQVLAAGTPLKFEEVVPHADGPQ